MSRAVSKKNIFKKSHPLVVGSVTTFEGLQIASQATTKDCDIIEVRLDLMPKSLLSHFTQLCKLLEVIKLPILATLRSNQEGGKCTWPLNWRLGFLEMILPHVDLIDLELFAVANDPGKIASFRNLGKIIILSYHDFEKLPQNQYIQKKIDEMFKAGADIAKVAGFIKSRKELTRILSLMEKQQKPVSLMGMGAYATESRVGLAKRGSLLNYGYIDQPAAPGQIRGADLLKKIRQTRHPGK